MKMLFYTPRCKVIKQQSNTLDAELLIRERRSTPQNAIIVILDLPTLDIFVNVRQQRVR